MKYPRLEVGDGVRGQAEGVNGCCTFRVGYIVEKQCIPAVNRFLDTLMMWWTGSELKGAQPHVAETI